MDRLLAIACLLGSTAPSAGTAVAASTETVLYSFTGGADGSGPGALTANQAGTLFGAAGRGATGAGVVFALSPPAAGGTTWSMQTVYALQGAVEGAGPASNLVLDQAGHLFGGTMVWGSAGCGTVYEVSPPAAGQTAWTASALHSFAGRHDGSSPASLSLLPSGQIIGITPSWPCSSVGTVFRLKPPASGETAWKKAELHRFSGGMQGALPESGLVADDTGNLYGATTWGGAVGEGMVFELVAPAPGVTQWGFSVLYNFSNAPSPGVDYQPQIFAVRDGVLYGTTQWGGNQLCRTLNGCGTVFTLAPPAAGQTAWTITVLHIFKGGPDGARPTNLILRKNGVMYGGAAAETLVDENGCCGSVFRLAPPAQGKTAWRFATVHSFAGLNGDGAANAYSQPMLIEAGGKLFGTTNAGGLYGKGTVFMISP